MGAGKAPNGLRKMDAYDGMSLCGGLLLLGALGYMLSSRKITG